MCILVLLGWVMGCMCLLLHGQHMLGKESHVLGNGPHVKGNGYRPHMLGNGPHVLCTGPHVRIMSSRLCHIWGYVNYVLLRDYVAFGFMSFVRRLVGVSLFHR